MAAVTAYTKLLKDFDQQNIGGGIAKGKDYKALLQERANGAAQSGSVYVPGSGQTTGRNLDLEAMRQKRTEQMKAYEEQRRLQQEMRLSTKKPEWPSTDNAGQSGTGVQKVKTPYAQRIEALIGEIENSEFSYDKNEDPNYQALRQQYMLEAERTAADVLGQASAATGGRASSHAVTAAAQAADYYKSQLSAEQQALFDSAYERHLSEYSKLLSELEILQGEEEKGYTRKEAAYQKLVEAIAKTGYDPNPSEMAAAGLTNEQVAAWKNYYQTQMALAMSGGGSGGGGSSSGSGKSYATNDVLDAIDDAYESGGYDAGKQVIENMYANGSILGVSSKGEYNSYLTYMDGGVDTSSWGEFARNTYNNLYRSKKNGRETADSAKKYLDNYVSNGRLTQKEADTIMKALGF